ncbi:MAG TPA: DUF2400 domain-containing protein [Puia sp.]|nr:DUF2400 domain-containing protein [Puia sp.]
MSTSITPEVTPGASHLAPDTLQRFLERKVKEYNRPSFIPDDPISIPHAYRKKQDIEIAGFFTAVFSWGNRTTIIRKSRELMQFMDDSPHQFVLNYTEREIRKLLSFKHRTFNPTDLLYFVEFLRYHYSRSDTLEDAFLFDPITDPNTEPNADPKTEPNTGPKTKPTAKPTANPIVNPIANPAANPAAAPIWDAETALTAFYHYFFSLEDVPPRTRKHIATPERNSSCKRLNMFLRWMARKDDNGVDFGCWERIPMNRLICPLDLHVARVARRFGLLTRKPTDWTAALELTERLARFDPADPVKYDFALFALGALEKF